jgi:hypothetical protein
VQAPFGGGKFYGPLFVMPVKQSDAWRKKQLNVHAQRFDFRT